jgi:hypothetical protein
MTEQMISSEAGFRALRDSISYHRLSVLAHQENMLYNVIRVDGGHKLIVDEQTRWYVDSLIVRSRDRREQGHDG